MAGQTTIAIQTGHAMGIVWGVKKTKRGSFVGVCDALGLTLEADTESELRSLIEEGIHFLMVDLLEDGDLPRFLKDRGWKTARPVPARLPKEGVRFEVPFRVERSRAHGHP
jgi:hypothetical protein